MAAPFAPDHMSLCAFVKEDLPREGQSQDQVTNKENNVEIYKGEEGEESNAVAITMDTNEMDDAVCGDGVEDAEEDGLGGTDYNTINNTNSNNRDNNKNKNHGNENGDDNSNGKSSDRNDVDGNNDGKGKEVGGENKSASVPALIRRKVAGSVKADNPWPQPGTVFKEMKI